MFRKIKKTFSRFREPDCLKAEIDPDVVFLDSKNLPDFNISQFEGRFERPIGRKPLAALGIFFVVAMLVFISRLWVLQIRDGGEYALASENNRLQYTVIFADRGLISDRTGMLLAWNDLPLGADFPLRKYIEKPGFAHVLGYVDNPKKDKYGFYYQLHYEGKSGVEESLDEKLRGINGVQEAETDALGDLTSASIVEPPVRGGDVTLSIDARVQNRFYEIIEQATWDYGFQGGGGIIMDIENGEILAMTSFPEFDSNLMSNGTSEEKAKELDKRNFPFLNRVVSGLYTPGSIVKPFMAAAALAEDTISPHKEIFSDGSLKLPNPYSPGKYTVFGDWKAHGWTDMREAIAASSDVYFYVIGGGFGDQKGLGITKIDEYMRKFGFEKKTGIALTGEKAGTIPTPEWKMRVFGEEWLLGNTYHTSIGQYGFQITPLQAVRAVASIANDGTLVTPTLVYNDSVQDNTEERIGLEHDDLQIVREGMRMVVADPFFGTAKTVNSPAVKIAAKTGTAELGISKALVNSWIIGFFPYDKPKYAFAVVMEKGSRYNIVGAPYVFRQLVDWMAGNTPEYFEDVGDD